MKQKRTYGVCSFNEEYLHLGVVLRKEAIIA